MNSIYQQVYQTTLSMLTFIVKYAIIINIFSFLKFVYDIQRRKSYHIDNVKNT